MSPLGEPAEGTGAGAPQPTWPSLYRGILRDILTEGTLVSAGATLSIGSSRPTLEILNHSFMTTRPTDRILPADATGLTRPFHLAAALGRFVWMLRGSDRVEEIAFYDPNAAKFSDDGYSVPGSSDGARLFNPRPGLNQIERLVDLLRTDEGTRRAVATIYHPEDAGRVSRDIPCHIAVAYNLRDGQLHASTIMRSCNAGRILPYDFFLFSLLAELVATMVGGRLSSYHQHTVSMHIYTDDLDGVRAMLADGSSTSPGAGDPGAAAASDDVGAAMAMPAMPARPAVAMPAVAMPEIPAGEVAASVRTLADCEARFRHTARAAAETGLTGAQVRRWLDQVAGELDDYWGSFARVLLLWAARVGRLPEPELDALIDEVRASVLPAFRAHL